MRIERSDLMRLLGVEYNGLRSIERRDQLEERLKAVGYKLIGREVINNNRTEYNVVPTSDTTSSDTTYSDTTTFEDFIENIEVYDEYTRQMRKPFIDKMKFRTFLIERFNKPSIDLNELAKRVCCSPATIIRWTKFLLENNAIGRKVIISSDQTITI